MITSICNKNKTKTKKAKKKQFETDNLIIPKVSASFLVSMEKYTTWFINKYTAKYFKNKNQFSSDPKIHGLYCFQRNTILKI